MSDTDYPEAAEWARVWLRQLREHRPEDFWSWDRLAMLNEPERMWRVVLELVAQASDGELEHIGAGPLEDIAQDHAPAFIDRIEALAAVDARFRAALGAVWLNTWGFAPALTARLLSASGGRIATTCFNPEMTEEEFTRYPDATSSASDVADDAE